MADPGDGPMGQGAHYADDGEASQYSYTGISHSIYMEKKNRKAVEEDAVKLYNRVRQLEKEEERAAKRVQETKQRAAEILLLRERNERKEAEREQHLQDLQTEIEVQREEMYRAKLESKKNKIENETKVYNERVLLANQTKEEKVEIERIVAEERLLARRKALRQKEEVRRQQEEAAMRAAAMKDEKIKMAQEEYEKRLREEIEARLSKEAELTKLASMELEIIERLKKKQAEQVEAFDQLEAAICLGKKTKKKVGGMHHTDMPPPPQPSDVPQGEPTEAEVAQAFSMYDADGTGHISTTQLDALMQRLGVPLNTYQLSQAIAQLDIHQTGSISFGEFLMWWKG